MHEDLNRILEEHYAIQAGGTSVMNPVSRHRRTPDDVLGTLREDCGSLNFRINYESDARAIARHVSHLVSHIHYALTAKIPEFSNQQHTDRDVVVTDHVYKIDGAIKILWEDKSPEVFDAFVGQLMNDVRAHGSGMIPYPDLSLTTYDGYQAILGKVHVVASVSSLLSESSLPLAFLPFQGRSAPDPLGSPF
ncbi:hypothetical protein BJV78DRAFT_1199730 [Lactifluus subvellereus]|nr:hypothetical protein BJV78DRAFT_1199730 [Lactifluus subvellereus]